MKSKERYHKEAESIDKIVTQETQYDEQQCDKRHKDF